MKHSILIIPLLFLTSLFSISLSYGQNKKIPTAAKNELEVADKYFESGDTESDYVYETYSKYTDYLSPEQQRRLADIYFQKIDFYFPGGDENMDKAIFYYEKSAAAGNEKAMEKLAYIYFSENFSNPTKAFYWYEKLANKGNADAMLQIGNVYTSNDFANAAKAIYWYEKAVKAKKTEALVHLGEMYFEGEIVPKDYLKAKNYLESYISQISTKTSGNALLKSFEIIKSYELLGYIYSTLTPESQVPKDNQKAIEYFEALTPESYDKIAEIYYHGGAGITKDKEKAENYFNDYLKEYEDKIIEVAQFYEKNNDNSLEWYRKAAKVYANLISEADEYTFEEKLQEWKENLQISKQKLNAFSKNFLFEAQKAMEQDEYTKAKEFYEEAITNGDDEAKMLLADLYYEGKLGVPNYTRAFELYKEPAEGYEDIAALRKAEMLYNGKGVSKNQSLAFRHYTEAANLGNTEAMLFLAQAYYNGTAVTKNDAEALKWYQKAANKGDLKAKAAYGKMLYYGIGTNPDKSTAATYLEQAAQAGDTEAMALYGLLCEDLLKTDQAKEWYQKAAEAQHPVALRQLGKLYATGSAVTKDDKKALELYQQAATANDAEAMNLLAGMYLEGIGTPKNPTEAFNWYQKAAKADMPAAMYSLANLYKKGKGVKKDKDKAYFWMQRACNLGYLSACDDKAVKKENGTSSLDTPKDIHKTYEYLSYNGYATPSKWQFVIAYSPLKILSKDFNHRLDTGFVKKKSNNLYFALNNEFGRFRFGFSTASSELEVPEEGYNEPLKGRIGYNNFVISWKYVPPILNDRLVLYPGISIVNNGYTLKRGKEEIFKDGTISLFYSAETNFYIIKYMSIVAGFARSIAASSKYAMQYFYIGIAINTGPFDNDNEI